MPSFHRTPITCSRGSAQGHKRAGHSSTYWAVCVAFIFFAVVFPVKILAAVSLTYTDNATDATNLTTYTFAGMDFGAASSDRIMVAAIIGGGTAATISSVTIGGVSASRVVQANNSNSNSAEIWTAAVPTGTSGDVVVVWSTGIARSGASLYRMTGAESTVIDTDTTGATNGLSAQFDLNQTINTVTGGAVVSVAYQGYFDPGTWTWTGLTEDVEGNVEADRSMTSASLSASSDETSRAVSTAFSIDTGAHNAVMVTASWEPTPEPVSAPVLSRPPNNLGLVGYWSLNEGAGTSAGDFSGNAKNGTLSTSGSGLPTWSNGIRGLALEFDGTDEYVSVGSVSSGVQTVSFWLKADDTTSRKIIDLNGTQQVELNDSSQVTATSFTSPTVYVDGSSASAVIDTEWHHVIITTGTGINASAADIGRVSAGYFDGKIDEVRLYTRALTASEAQSLARARAVRLGASTADLQKGTTLESGLVGHWTFDGADSHATITDRSGQGNHGYFTNGPTSTAKVLGKLGQALNFDGVDDFVRVTNPTSFNFGTADFTMAAWVKRRVIGEEHMIISKSDENAWAAGGKLFNIGATNRLFLDQNGVGFETSSATIADTDWHHVVVTFDDTTNTVLFYIDGALDGGGGVLALTADNGAHVVKIGRIGTDPAIDGMLDDVRVYSKVLSAAEIKQLYNIGSTRISN